MEIKVADEKDYPKIVTFFIENELEFSEDEPVSTDLIKVWKAEESNELVGAIALAMREERFIIDGIAVDPKYRKDGLGKTLLNLAIEETKKLGGTAIYLVARAPGFFRTQGFEQVDKSKAPTFFECWDCPQYGVNCHPEVMKLEVK